MCTTWSLFNRLQYSLRADCTTDTPPYHWRPSTSRCCDKNVEQSAAGSDVITSTFKPDLKTGLFSLSFAWFVTVQRLKLFEHNVHLKFYVIFITLAWPSTCSFLKVTDRCLRRSSHQLLNSFVSFIPISLFSFIFLNVCTSSPFLSSLPSCHPLTALKGRSVRGRGLSPPHFRLGVPFENFGYLQVQRKENPTNVLATYGLPLTKAGTAATSVTLSLQA